MSRDNDQKRKYFLIRKYHVTLPRKKAVTYISQINVQLSFLKKSTRFLQLPAFYLVHPWPTTLQRPWTYWLAPTMWTLARVKTDLDDFLGPKMTPTTCILN